MPTRKVKLKAKLFRGLADPSRLAILEALQKGPLNVSQVIARTKLSQPNASMHLDCLWCCGLVDRTARGRFTFYRLRSRSVIRILNAAESTLELVKGRIDSCGRYD